ncbi:MAG: hypothetical protein ACP5P4_04205 [Steroidobacteraceae bacterium]
MPRFSAVVVAAGRSTFERSAERCADAMDRHRGEFSVLCCGWRYGGRFGTVLRFRPMPRAGAVGLLPGAR